MFFLFNNELNISFTVIWSQTYDKNTIQITREKTCCYHFIGYSFRRTAMALLHSPFCKQDSIYHSHCYTSCGTLAGMKNSSKYLMVDCTPYQGEGARCSSVVRAFAHGAMGRQIDSPWGGPIELFLVPASAPRLV